jgi:hypothetical protein
MPSIRHSFIFASALLWGMAQVFGSANAQTTLELFGYPDGQLHQV